MMLIKNLRQLFPKTWRAELQEMYLDGFALCLKCDGLPHEDFIEAHNSACPNKLCWKHGFEDCQICKPAGPLRAD